MGLRVIMYDTNMTCDTCDCVDRKNVSYFFTGDFEGIPENMAINLIVWALLLLAFLLLRRFAWDHDRASLVNKDEERWTSMFYGSYDHQENNDGEEEFSSRDYQLNKGFLSWIPAFFKVKDADILLRSGRDAVHYLSFQRYLIVYLTIIGLLSIIVILPINYSGNNLGNGTEFGDTTIGNLETNSPLLWVHAVLALGYLVIAVVMMRHFAVNMEEESDEKSTPTLMISQIPPKKCEKRLIQQHFTEAYPELMVVDIRLSYDIRELMDLETKRKVAVEAKQYSESELCRCRERPQVTPHRCGQCCCCGCEKKDAIEYYEQEESELTEKCEQERLRACRNPLGIAFVTFKSKQMASTVREDFRLSCAGIGNPASSSVARELSTHRWSTRFAPTPENIIWENLSVTPAKWWVRAIIVNILLFLLLFFLTTPSVILTTIDDITGNFTSSLEVSHNNVIEHFLPTLLLRTFSALLPNVAYFADQFIGHWTITAGHHSVMRKTFAFLLLMILILPSLGLTSAKALFEGLVLNEGQDLRWGCIFLSGNGAFFVNFLITCAFIGTGLELIRFGELFMYGMKLACSRSAAEKSAVKKSVVSQFQFGTQYAWMLCIFTVTVAYSIPCPMVVPFGFIYLVFKHIVDRYNLYFSFSPSRINKQIHHTAVNFVIISVILLQLVIVFFTGLRSVDRLEPIFLFSAVVLVLTIILFSGRIFFGCFKTVSKYTIKRFMTEEEHIEEDTASSLVKYVAPVLMEHLDEPIPMESQSPRSSYGTMHNEISPKSSVNIQQAEC